MQSVFGTPHRVQRMPAAVSQIGGNIDVEEISGILKSYPADCQPTAIESLGSAGGLSGARFWRIVAPRGALALRCWPIEHPTPAGLQFIHSVLRQAADRGLDFLPVPLRTNASDTLIGLDGHLWDLAPWLPGTADYERDPRTEKLRAAMTALANFHVAVRDFPTSPASGFARSSPTITRRLARLVELQNGGIQQLTHSISDELWPDLAPLAREFTAGLPRAVPIAIARLAPLAKTLLPIQPCIRDVWHDHVLFTGDSVTGLIDFGAMDIDTSTVDVARLLGSLVADDVDGWREGVAAYSQARPLSKQELVAVPALDISGTIVAGCNWIRWVYLERREFAGRIQIESRLRRIASRTQKLPPR